MAGFRSKWLDFQPEKVGRSTDKTDKNTSVSFVSAISKGPKNSPSANDPSPRCQPRAKPKEIVLNRRPDGRYGEVSQATLASALVNPAVRMLIDAFDPVQIIVRPLDEGTGDQAARRENSEP